MHRLILSVLLITSCTTKTEVKEYWSTGELRALGLDEDGKRVGKWTYFRMYNQDTDYVDYYEHGVFIMKDQYTYIKMSDSTVSPTTKLTSRTEYRDSIKHGAEFSFDSLGRIRSKGSYIDGRINGEFFMYDSLGNIHTTGNYKNDTIISFEQFQENGKTLLKGNNPRNGMLDYFDSTGTHKFKLEFKDWILIDTIPLE